VALLLAHLISKKAALVTEPPGRLNDENSESLRQRCYDLIR